MSRSKVQPELTDTLDPLTRGEKEFFRRRVSTFATIGVVFALLHFGLYALAGGFHGEFSDGFLLHPLTVTAILNVAVFGSTLVLTRWVGLPWQITRHLDWICLFLFSLVLVLSVWMQRDYAFSLLILTKSLALAVTARAVLVPDRALRTATVSLLAYIPIFVAGHLVVSAPDAPEALRDLSYTTFVARGLLSVALATVVSSVVFGLVRRVRKAQQLGQYRLDYLVGEGGMGQVYRASHSMLRRPTAVKLLNADVAGKENLARFEREVQLTSQLSHPNTIAIFDYGHTPDNTFYYAMEFLDGLNLEEIVHSHGPLPAPRVIHVLEQVCGSLGEAHAAGMIHRDVKPANIILCLRGGLHDFVKVVDFGLVKHVDERPDVRVTAADVITGTPLYMSPEAVSTPEAIDSRSDLYALGCVAYYLLTGQPIFEGNNPVEICHHQYSTPPKPMRERVDFEIPGDLAEVVMSCLQKDPLIRPQSAADLLAGLRSCRDHGRWDESMASAWWDGIRKEAVSQAETATTQRELHKKHPTVEVDFENRFAAR